MSELKSGIFIFIWLFFATTAIAYSGNEPIKVTLQSSTITLDPGGIQDTQSLLVSRQINCQLFRNIGATFALDAAESVKYISPLKIILKINKKSKFHDGSSVTAKDVLASFDYIKNTRSVFTNLFHWIKRIDIIDKSTLIIDLKEPAPEFLKVLSSTNYTIYKSSFLKKAMKNKTLWRFSEGCGGYRVSEYVGNRIKLSPISKGFPIEFYLNSKNQISVQEANKYDIVTLNVVDQKGVLPGFNLINMFDPVQYYIGLNAQSSNFHLKSDRCNFLSGLDVGQFVLRYGSPSIVAQDLIPRDTLGYNPESGFKHKIESYSNNAEVSHFKDSHRRFCLSYLTVSVQEKNKKDYLSMISKVVPVTKIQPISDVSHFGKDFVDSGCDAIIFGLRSNYFDGYEFLTVYEDNDANFTGIKDEWLSAQIKGSQMFVDPLERASVYRKIINRIADSCIVMPLFTVTMKEIYLKKNIRAPGIGLVSFDQYYLGNITRSTRSE